MMSVTIVYIAKELLRSREILNHQKINIPVNMARDF